MASETSWWSSNGHKFFATAVVCAVVLFCVGWFTDARVVMYDAFIAIAVVALLPFAIVAVVLGVALVIGLLLALPAALVDEAEAPIEGAADFALEGGGQLVPWYYRFFARQRHPVFWGIPAGVLLGALLLFGALALTRFPRERDTVDVLKEAKLAVDGAYKKDGSFPRPVGGHLVIDGKTFTDGFGRDLAYEVDGRWKLARYTLRSHGQDGVKSDDDLCIHGESSLVAVVADSGDADVQSLRCE